MIKSINPSTEKIIGEFKKTSFTEIDSLLDKSKAAQKGWFLLSKEKRISILKNMKISFENNKEKLIEVIHEECGFDKEEIEGVFYDVLDGFDYYSDICNKKKNIEFPIDKNAFPESTSEIKFYPQGVIVQIGAWNYPLWQTMITVIPALLTGNSILYKPSEKAIKTGLLISEIINNSKDFPENLFSVIVGDKKEGKYLVGLDADLIVYTGNIKTGKEISRDSELKPKVLELSGNDAAIVCKDCDIEQTVDGVVSGSFLHSGQVCDRIKRIYVVSKIADEFIEKMVNKISNIKDLVTPLISLEALDNVNSQISQTVKDGAQILTGGKRMDKEGFYFEPTLLKLKHNDVLSVKEEIFGPVVSLLVVDYEEEAIELSNSTEFGLGTSVWTQDLKRASEISEKCESGMVWINDSNIPLVCGEYFKGWKSTSIPNASDRLSMFQKSKTIISFNSNKKRDWWF